MCFDWVKSLWPVYESWYNFAIESTLQKSISGELTMRHTGSYCLVSIKHKPNKPDEGWTRVFGLLCRNSNDFSWIFEMLLLALLNQKEECDPIYIIILYRMCRRRPTAACIMAAQTFCSLKRTTLTTGLFKVLYKYKNENKNRSSNVHKLIKKIVRSEQLFIQFSINWTCIFREMYIWEARVWYSKEGEETTTTGTKSTL